MDKFEAKLTRALEGLMAILLFAMFVTVVALVALRYLFNASITGANELIIILFVYTTAIGAALAIGSNEHLSVVFAIEKLPAKWRRIADLFRILLVGAINAVALYYSIQWISVTGDFLMPSTGLPRWVAQLSIPLGCLLAMCYTVFQWRRALCAGESPTRGQSVASQQTPG